jgi:2-polyprenyl-3-methyl-5-hydroxy-6-metoxy-1,4-benzoquinol methylase
MHSQKPARKGVNKGANMSKSESSHAVLDPESRRRKARKIAAMVSDHVDLSKAELLDMGTGSGHIAEEFGKAAKRVVSVDVTDERQVQDGYEFVQVDSAKLPFPDNSFDVVVSNHVVEHVPDQSVHLQELVRVLRPGGVAYLATPNKLWLRDPHYRLPFISWLPRRASDRYLKLFKPDKIWDIYPLSHFGIKKHLRGHKLHNALPDLVKKKAATLDVWRGAAKVLQVAPSRLLVPTQYLSPTLIYIVKKR